MRPAAGRDADRHVCRARLGLTVAEIASVPMSLATAVSAIRSADLLTGSGGSGIRAYPRHLVSYRNRWWGDRLNGIGAGSCGIQRAIYGIVASVRNRSV